MENQTVVRQEAPFEVISEFTPSGDQPTAIKELAERINAGEKDIVLLGATGTGKSATAAWLIEKIQRPTLVMAPNKTLAAQLAAELRHLLPNNAVEYFVSYYDYYQPEAYVPQTDTYIERFSILTSASGCDTGQTAVDASTPLCLQFRIYGLVHRRIRRVWSNCVGMEVERDDLPARSRTCSMRRNDMSFTRGIPVRGDTTRSFPCMKNSPSALKCLPRMTR